MKSIVRSVPVGQLAKRTDCVFGLALSDAFLIMSLYAQ